MYLRNNGVSAGLCDFIEDYLAPRSAVVIVQGTKSTPLCIDKCLGSRAQVSCTSVSSFSLPQVPSFLLCAMAVTPVATPTYHQVLSLSEDEFREKINLASYGEVRAFCKHLELFANGSKDELLT